MVGELWDKPLLKDDGTSYTSADLKFTSEHALKRSVDKIYGHLPEKVRVATCDHYSKFIGWKKDKNENWVAPK